MNRPWERLEVGAQRLSGFVLLSLPLILSADWHFLFLSPHGGTRLPTASVFACLHFQTPRERLTSFVSCSSQILGENSIGLFGWGTHSSNQWAVPRVHALYQSAVPGVTTCLRRAGSMGEARAQPLAEGEAVP